MSRAARVLQAITVEAVRRGFVVLSVTQAKDGAPDRYDARAFERCRVALRTPGGIYGIRIQEVSASSDTVVDPVRRYRRTRAAWLDARHTEFVGTGLLELIVYGLGAGVDGDRYRDSTTIAIEDRLPQLFKSIEVYRLQGEAREQEREQEAADRQRRWEAAMVEARLRYERQVRWDAFERHARDWRSGNSYREFLIADRQAVESFHGQERDAITAQLDLAERTPDETDPVRHPDLLVVDVPDPKPDDLKPYLDGWSPHGPDSMRW